MTRLLRSLLGSLLAILGLSWGAAPAFAIPTSAVVAYCYDGTLDAAGSGHLSTERGPPAAFDCNTTYDAVDRWSHGASACPQPGTSSDAITYDVPSTLELGARATATTREQAQGDGGALSAFAPSGVAAETGWTVPTRLARVTEAKFAASPSLGPPGAGRVFVTAAEDIEGISTSQGLAERLTLLDDAGKLREGPFAVTTFDTPAEGLGVPVFRTNPGFVQGGFTQGGAREFDLDNLLYKELGNVEQRIVP